MEAGEDDLAAFLSAVNVDEGPPRKRAAPAAARQLPSFLYEDGVEPAVIERDGSLRERASSDEEVDLAQLLGPRVVNVEYGSAAEECARLTSKVFTNAFEVFKLPAFATEDDLKKAFRKLSLLIHPDKCSHEKAKEAFHVATQAVEKMERPAAHAQYRGVYSKAKSQVLENLQKQNRARKAKNEPPLPTDDAAIRPAVIERCEAIVKQLAENLAYSEETWKANQQWELDRAAERAAEEAAEAAFKKEWAATASSRTEGWRSYQDDLRNKRVETKAFQPLPSFKEKRPAPPARPAAGGGRPAKPTSKPVGIDESYKEKWR